MFDDWVSIAATLAALIAAWLAFRTAGTVKRANHLGLERKQFIQPSLELFLFEANILPFELSGAWLYVFRIIVTNKCNLWNSIEDLRRIIEHHSDQGAVSNVAIPHERELAVHLPKGSKDVLKIPCGISANVLLGGMVLFRVSSDILRISRVTSTTTVQRYMPDL